MPLVIILLLFGSLLVYWTTRSPQDPFNYRGGHVDLIMTGAVLGLVVCFCIWLAYSLYSRFVSEKEAGEIGTDRAELLHQTGTAFTNLRPAGTALINGKRVDVVTEGQMIERGCPVQVVAADGLRVVVRVL